MVLSQPESPFPGVRGGFICPFIYTEVNGKRNEVEEKARVEERLMFR